MTSLENILNKGMKVLNYKGKNFGIQAYEENNFVNLIEILENEMGEFVMIDFNKKTFSSYKENIEYLKMINIFNLEELQKELKLIF